MPRPLEVTRQILAYQLPPCRVGLSSTPKRSIRMLLGALLFILQLLISPAQAQRGIDTLNTSSALTPDVSGDYSIVGRGTALFPSNQTFNLSFNTGMGNLSLDGFSIAGTEYSRITNADQVFVRRVGNANSSTQRFRYFAEAEVVGNDINIQPTRPSSIEDIVLSNIINRGVLDFFRNDNGGIEQANNVERLDVVFTQGLTAPAVGLNEAGFMQVEKSGNNPFQIAAITAIDGAGNPTAYGPLVLVMGAPSPDYSLTNVTTTNVFFENNAFDTPPSSGDHGLPAPLHLQPETPWGSLYLATRARHCGQSDIFWLLDDGR